MTHHGPCQTRPSSAVHIPVSWPRSEHLQAECQETAASLCKLPHLRTLCRGATANWWWVRLSKQVQQSLRPVLDYRLLALPFSGLFWCSQAPTGKWRGSHDPDPKPQVGGHFQVHSSTLCILLNSQTQTPRVGCQTCGTSRDPKPNHNSDGTSVESNPQLLVVSTLNLCRGPHPGCQSPISPGFSCLGFLWTQTNNRLSPVGGLKGNY